MSAHTWVPTQNRYALSTTGTEPNIGSIRICSLLYSKQVIATLTASPTALIVTALHGPRRDHCNYPSGIDSAFPFSSCAVKSGTCNESRNPLTRDVSADGLSRVHGTISRTHGTITTPVLKQHFVRICQSATGYQRPSSPNA